MKLHLLVNISSDTENHFGVRFLCSFFQKSEHCNVTLFHICRLDSTDSMHALTKMWKEPDKKIDGKLTAGARRAMDRATKILGANKFPVHQMKTKIVEERFGKVKDILSEGANGLYDSMILGRRATYALQWLFDKPADEIPQAMIKDSSLSCPLWVCCEPEPGRNDVLLCVDGSESALRAADHIGYILSFAQHHSVTIFHVITTTSGNYEEILENTYNVLLAHNIDTGRIRCKTIRGLTIAGAILGEKNKGQYAAIAVGLQGLSSHDITGFGRIGGTTSTLINKISKATLWCCP